jgi:hypothetical protein
VVRKSNIRAPKLAEHIKVEPSVAMVKYLLVENIDGRVIYFYDEAARIAKPDEKTNIDLLLACLLSQLK